MTHEVGAIILAAGFSNRFGSTKLTAKLYNGATVFEQTLKRVRSAIPNYAVVTRPVLSEKLKPYEDNLNIFENAEMGMGASLAYGIKLANSWNACLVCLADMPFIQIETYSAIANELRGNNIVIPVHKKKIGNPVGFGKNFFADLMNLSGDSGGRTIIQANQNAIVRLATDDSAILQDIDTQADLEKYQARTD
ncbi:MAG: hypothetical protein CMQ41_11540 [Gammaproteobacteria bacterium]|nr:hypothetical protein [Gammaproteobacteria bacterium]